jgi:hypothetical protein
MKSFFSFQTLTKTARCHFGKSKNGLSLLHDPSAPNGQPERYYQVKNP